MRTTTVLTLSCLVGLIGCASTGKAPPYPKIVVAPLESGRMSGARADYVVDAPLETVADILLDFEARAKARPRILSLTRISGDENKGLVRLEFREAIGIQGELVCRYEVTRSSDEVRRVLYKVDSSVALWNLRAEWVIRRLSDGRTWVSQQYLASTLSQSAVPLTDRLRLVAEGVRSAAESASR